MLRGIPPLLFMSEPETSAFAYNSYIKRSDMTLNDGKYMRYVQNLCSIREGSLITLCFRQTKHTMLYVGFECNLTTQITAPNYCF